MRKTATKTWEIILHECSTENKLLTALIYKKYRNVQTVHSDIPLVHLWGQRQAKSQSQSRAGAQKAEAFRRKVERNWTTNYYVYCSSVKPDIYQWTAPAKQHEYTVWRDSEQALECPVCDTILHIINDHSRVKVMNMARVKAWQMDTAAILL